LSSARPDSDMRPGFHLLLADDDDSLRDCLRTTLEASGYVVSAAGCGAQAIELARTVEIHCSILDYRMPDMTGLEVYRQLRALRPGSPSILMSAECGGSLWTAASDLGIAFCLAKPIAVDDLRARVAELLRTRPPGRSA